MPQDSLHLNQIDYPFEVFLRTDRNHNRTRISTQDVLHLAYNLKEVSTRTVHLVDIPHTRYIILVSLTPYRFRLRFNTTYSTVCSHGTIQHTQRTFYLCSKVHVSRSIDQVNFICLTIPFPTSCRSSRSNSNTALLLLSHPVHRSSTIVHLSDLMRKTGIEKNTL